MHRNTVPEGITRMDYLVGKIIENLKAVNYEGPAIFVIIFLALLGLFRKWSILLITLFVIVLGWGAQDLIIMNLKTQSTVVNFPLIIYGCGGLLVLVLVLISFYKS